MKATDAELGERREELTARPTSPCRCHAAAPKRSPEIIQHRSETRAQPRLITPAWQLAESVADDPRVGEPQAKQGADEFEVFQPTRGQFGNHQVVNLQTMGGDCPSPEWAEAPVPARRKTRQFRRYDVHVESLLAGKPGTATQFRIEQVRGLRPVLRVKITLLGKRNLGGRSPAQGVNCLRPDEEELVISGNPAGSS